MEIEMKYAIPSKEIAEEIWNDEIIQEKADPSSVEKIVMKAIYFDTEDGILANNNVALRIRAEGERCFATLKWGGKSNLGLHERQEVNIPICGEECFIRMPADIFSESEEGKMLMELIKDKPLINLLETRFLRKRVRLAAGSSLVELAIDTGSIVTDNGELPILEMELELFAGDIKDLSSVGEKIAEKYELEPENRSKFARGINLIKKGAA